MVAVEPRRPDDGLWKVEDVAAYLRFSTSWVYKATASGKLPVRYIGGMLRFVPAQIHAFANGGKADLGIVDKGPRTRRR